MKTFYLWEREKSVC